MCCQRQHSNSHFFKKSISTKKSCPYAYFGPQATSLGSQYCPVHGAGCEGGTNPTDSCLFGRRTLIQKSWFSPKGNVPMNILKSINLIHIPEAFSKAEAQLHAGMLQSRDIWSSCGENSMLLPILRNREVSRGIRSCSSSPSSSWNIPILIHLFGEAIGINNNVSCTYGIC